MTFMQVPEYKAKVHQQYPHYYFSESKLTSASKDICNSADNASDGCAPLSL